jgi:hypothetical protein
MTSPCQLQKAHHSTGSRYRCAPTGVTSRDGGREEQIAPAATQKSGSAANRPGCWRKITTLGSCRRSRTASGHAELRTSISMPGGAWSVGSKRARRGGFCHGMRPRRWRIGHSLTQPIDRAAGHVLAVAHQLPPHLTGAVDLVVRVPGGLDSLDARCPHRDCRAQSDPAWLG